MRGLVFRIALVFLCTYTTTTFASNRSIGQDGINSVDLPRTGAGIGIGQVEDERPGDEDAGDHDLNFSSSVDPEEVFFRDGPATANMHVEPGHATEVASVMISDDTSDLDMDGDNPRGVAPGAKLYASAVDSSVGFDHDLQALSAQHVANQNGGDVSAINFSFLNISETGQYDGSSLLTQFVDWSARTHETLYVIAGTQVGRLGPVPGDNFNGVTVAMSTFAADGVYRRVDSRNRFDEDANGDRTSVDLLAPGDGIVVNTRGSVDSNAQATRIGTSFAAPHVTGTIALLQEEAKLMSTNAQRHQVMKAVLLNSADKVKGIIGMERTVLKKSDTPSEADDNDWFDTTAHSNSNIPLDIEMGAGHLNAQRAYQQLTAGEQPPGGIQLTGWDYLIHDDEFSNYTYSFNQLNEGDYVSITLVWDRVVFLDSPFPDYEPGDTFIDAGFWNLDLHLINLGTGQTIASSTSGVENLEHMFVEIPTTGSYRIDVDLNETDGNYNVPYALAWWAGPDLREPVGQGDFNGDGNVDAADYVMWRKSNGSSMEYGEWVENFGSTSGSGGAVPEPAGVVMAVVLAACLGVRRGRRGG